MHLSVQEKDTTFLLIFTVIISVSRATEILKFKVYVSTSLSSQTEKMFTSAFIAALDSWCLQDLGSKCGKLATEKEN